MVMVSKFSNFPDKLRKNEELREYEFSKFDCKLSGGADFYIFRFLMQFFLWNTFSLGQANFKLLQSNFIFCSCLVH